MLSCRCWPHSNTQKIASWKPFNFYKVIDVSAEQWSSPSDPTLDWLSNISYAIRHMSVKMAVGRPMAKLPEHHCFWMIGLHLLFISNAQEAWAPKQQVCCVLQSTPSEQGIPKAIKLYGEGVNLVRLDGKEKKKKDYAFWRQFNEKPSIIPGCPERVRLDGILPQMWLAASHNLVSYP